MVRWSPAGSPQSRGGALIPRRASAEHEAKIPDDLIATLRRLADELGVTVEFGAVGCARQGARRTVWRARGRDGLRRPARRPRPLLCRLTTEPDSWRDVAARPRIEPSQQLLAHA